MTLHFLFYKAIAEHSFVFQMSLNSCPQLYISYIIMNILYIAYIVHVEQTKLYFNTSVTPATLRNSTTVRDVEKCK